MTVPTSESDHSPRAAAFSATAVLAATIAWLISRVFVGLDFTDEMQYYGEISSLVETNKFFQNDLFLQQLGYLLVLPFFKLHALAFPDQSYLFVFGRLLCLAAYAAVGVLLWRSLPSPGPRSRTDKLGAVGTFLAWIPFQLFAFSYNSLAYLLIVSLICVWLVRGRLRHGSYLAVTAALLAGLAVSYPPAGILLSVVAVAEAWRRLGHRVALQLAGAIVAAAVTVAAIVLLLHGADFIDDLLVSLQFSGGFSGGQIFRNPEHIVALGGIAVVAFLCLRRLYARRPLALLPAGGVINRRMLGVLVVAALAALLIAAVRWRAGYFAPGLFVVLVLMLALTTRPTDDVKPADLASLGLLLGSLFAISGGDGMLNFATGIAPTLPFLMFYVVHRVQLLAGGVWPGLIAGTAVPIAVGCLLLNGATHPYREQVGWSGYAPVRGIPAFAGIWTSRTKVETMETLRQLSEHGALRGKRVLVAGPHAWLYFASGGKPTTCMFFMHYTADPDKQEIYELIARRMFRSGTPDAVFVTNVTPPPIGRLIQAWTAEPHTSRTLPLPIGFIRRYRHQTEYDFAGQIYLFIRNPAKP